MTIYSSCINSNMKLHNQNTESLFSKYITFYMYTKCILCYVCDLLNTSECNVWSLEQSQADFSFRLLIWQVKSHYKATGKVAFQSLWLKDHCAGKWEGSRHVAKSMPHTHTISLSPSLTHGAPMAKVSAFSRQNKGVWKGLGNYRGMCISVYTAGLTWRQLLRAQFKSTTGRPCVRRAPLIVPV